jgi:DNA polymerase-3 subunit epsilon
MTAAPWYRGPMVGFDLETTSTDVETARIVGAAVVVVQAGARLNGSRSWVVNPGVPISPESADVHGMTDDYVAEHGERPSEVVPLLAGALRDRPRSAPLVVFNAPFDLTILDRELRRHHGPALGNIGPVIDPFVLDKLIDPYRKGSRKLAAVARHYRAAELNSFEVHQAKQDAMAAVRLAWKIGHCYPVIGTRSLDDLQHLQAKAKASQAASLDRYFQRTRNPEAGKVDGSWPMRPWESPDVAESPTS